jgi:hypothetical protein
VSARPPITTRGKIFSQRKKNSGRAATGIDHNVRPRIAHLADKGGQSPKHGPGFACDAIEIRFSEARPSLMSQMGH